MAIFIEEYKGGNIGKYIKKLFEQINFIPKGTVFIKPNLCARPPVRKGENTDTKFLESLVDLLLSFGCTVMIGHTSLLGTPDRDYPFDEIIKSTGLKYLKLHKNVKLINLDEQEQKIINHNGFNFEIPKLIFEVNYYINVAKLKTHMQTGISLTLKNQLGLLSQANRIEIHRMGIDGPIASLASILRPKINLIDGILGMEGKGPHHGRIKRVNLIFCGDDMVELDSFVTGIMGLDFQNINHIKLAKELGVGKFVDKSLINKYKNKINKFIPAENFIVKWNRIYIWPNKGCPRCMVALNETAKWLKKKPHLLLKLLIRNNRLDIIYGKASDMDLSKMQTIIGIGKCSEEFCRDNGITYLSSCPPRVNEIISYLRMNLKI